MERSENLRMTPLEWGLLVVLSVLWGGAFFLIEIALRDLPPFTIMIFRVTGAALFLWVIVLVRGVTIPRGPLVDPDDHGGLQLGPAILADRLGPD